MARIGHTSTFLQDVTVLQAADMPMPPVPDTWHRRDLPVLREAVSALDRDPNSYLRAEDIAEALDLKVGDVQVSLGLLKGDGYLDGPGVAEIVGVLMVTSVSAKARREVGSWPSENYARQFLRVLDDAIVNQPEAAPKLRRLRDVATDVGTGVLAGVLSGVVSGQLPH